MTSECAAFKIGIGNCSQLGTYRNHTGVNFSLNIPEGVEGELRIYAPETDDPMQTIPMDKEYRIGYVSALHVAIPANVAFEYNYLIDGEIVPDPFAKSIRLHQKADGTEEFRCALLPKFVMKTMPLKINFSDSIFYKLHVRGFTMGMNPPVKNAGSFTALREKLSYVKSLGITSLILMPVYEFQESSKKKKQMADPMGEYRNIDELLLSGKVFEAPEDCAADTDEAMQMGEKEAERNAVKAAMRKKERKNYWGYAEGLYFVPKKSYCATDNPAKEFAALVDAIHKKGMECILEFYFPEFIPGWKVVQVLRFWRFTYHVDGFHILGHGDWISAVTDDLTLTGTKFLYEYFDQNKVYEKKYPYFRNLCMMNRNYQNTMRCFLKGDEGLENSAKWFLRNTSESIASVNYFADNDGFTMADMVAYEMRHNEDNGEDNQDGSDQNFTWNGGAEGPTKKRVINKFRQQQLRNAFAMLMTSQASPMIYGGDECGNSQNGNNNAWCQDNEVGWQSWKKTKDARNLRSFVEKMIAFRKAHPILRLRNPMRQMDYKSLGYPDVSYHGSIAWYVDNNRMKNAFGIMYCGDYASGEYGYSDDFIYVAYNMYWIAQDFALPDLPSDKKWSITMDTALEDSFRAPEKDLDVYFDDKKHITVAPRSIVILTSRELTEEEKAELEALKQMELVPESYGEETEEANMEVLSEDTEEAGMEAISEVTGDDIPKTVSEEICKDAEDEAGSDEKEAVATENKTEA